MLILMRLTQLSEKEQKSKIHDTGDYL